MPIKKKIFKLNENIFYSPGEYFVDLALVSFSDHHDFILDALSFTLSEGQLIKRGFFPKHVKVSLKRNGNNANYLRLFHF